MCDQTFMMQKDQEISHSHELAYEKINRDRIS